LLRSASFATALNNDRAGYDALGQVQALRARRELLTNALAEAERIEAEKLAGLQSREMQTRKRSLSPHSGRLLRDAKDVSTALSALHDAQQRLEASGGSIVALLPPHLRCPAAPFHELLSPGRPAWCRRSRPSR